MHAGGDTANCKQRTSTMTLEFTVPKTEAPVNVATPSAPVNAVSDVADTAVIWSGTCKYMAGTSSDTVPSWEARREGGKEGKVT